jgi:hypothetical protein
MELQLSNLAGILEKIKEVTGLPAYFNDRSQTTSMAKFDLRYKGFNWNAPYRNASVVFELALICSGVGEEFTRQLINTEMAISEAFEMPAELQSTETKKHAINANEKIMLLWNMDLGTIEASDGDKGTNYTYKRYFELYYEFKNL